MELVKQHIVLNFRTIFYGEELYRWKSPHYCRIYPDGAI
jgi:hypothetical protein